MYIAISQLISSIVFNISEAILFQVTLFGSIAYNSGVFKNCFEIFLNNIINGLEKYETI